MKTPHIVPLSTQAVEILRVLQLVSGQGALLFPGDRDHEKPMSNNTILGASARMGYKHRMTGHGFRGIASTLLHEMGFDHAHIELQLAQWRNVSTKMHTIPNGSMLRNMKYTLECEREDDGRFLAEVPELPGVLAYGKTEDEAKAKAEALALRVLAEKLETSESKPQGFSFEVLAPA